MVVLAIFLALVGLMWALIQAGEYFFNRNSLPVQSPQEVSSFSSGSVPVIDMFGIGEASPVIEAMTSELGAEAAEAAEIAGAILEASGEFIGNVAEGAGQLMGGFLEGL